MTSDGSSGVRKDRRAGLQSDCRAESGRRQQKAQQKERGLFHQRTSFDTALKAGCFASRSSRNRTASAGSTCAPAMARRFERELPVRPPCGS